VPGEDFPFQKLREYLSYLIVIWNETLKLSARDTPGVIHENQTEWERRPFLQNGL
jgi:hypothetical protein